MPLRAGDRGEAVADVQRRLAALGYSPHDDRRGCYGDGTASSVRAFQLARGLPPTGTCDEVTWTALVEAGHRLGSRLLYLRRPMLRGDDVAELQRRLGALGFDAGRVDGIFGPGTEAALREFQGNVALTADGIFGPDSRAALLRLGAKAASPESVAGLREEERLRHAPRSLAGRRLVVGQGGGLEALATATARALRDQGADVLTADDPDASAQARLANEAGADAFVGLATHLSAGCLAAYYSTTGFTSPGGKRLAGLLAEHVAPVLARSACECRGMTLPVLRETRMPAVLCELGPPAVVVERLGPLAAAVAAAVARWAQAPVGP